VADVEGGQRIQAAARPNRTRPKMMIKPVRSRAA
jgi:hypothetical protein